jgi:putative effector of murein hydrolase LrgA (UPF0299 family)
MTLTWNRVLLLIAVVLFLLATLVAGGIVSGSLGWAVPGGLTAFALAFLLPLGASHICELVERDAVHLLRALGHAVLDLSPAGTS